MKSFSSLAAFGEHILALQAAEHEGLAHGLKKAAELVEKTAKDEIGHYQQAVGPFPKWPQLAESTEAEKARLGYPADSPLLRTGALRESVTHEVEGMEAIIGTGSKVAPYQEFGTDEIPPRPFMGPAAFVNEEAIKKSLGESAVSWLAGRIGPGIGN